MRWHDLLWVLMSYAVKRRPVVERAALFAAAEASQAAVALQMEVRSMSQQVQETWDQWAERHYTEEGVKKGHKEGLAEGQVVALKKALLRQGRQKFGQTSPDAEASLLALTDLERLERLMERIMQVNTWQELLDTP
jgi:flagellar biosynthesis/type III secretory pathway protein FliH